jgi:hypothetical protein
MKLFAVAGNAFVILIAGLSTLRADQPSVAAICGPALDRTGREYATLYEDSYTFASVYSQTCRSSEEQMNLSWASISEKLGLSKMSREQWCAVNKSQFESASHHIETHDTVSASALRSWLTCLELFHSGIAVQEDVLPGMITYQLQRLGSAEGRLKTVVITSDSQNSVKSDTCSASLTTTQTESHFRDIKSGEDLNYVIPPNEILTILCRRQALPGRTSSERAYYPHLMISLVAKEAGRTYDYPEGSIPTFEWSQEALSRMTTLQNGLATAIENIAALRDSRSRFAATRNEANSVLDVDQRVDAIRLMEPYSKVLLCPAGRFASGMRIGAGTITLVCGQATWTGGESASN